MTALHDELEPADADIQPAKSSDAGVGLLLAVMRNRNLRIAELSYGAALVASTTWMALLLVLTFKAAGPVGPGIFVLVRTIVGAFAAPAAAALAERWRRERVVAASLLLRFGTAVATIGILHQHLPIAALYAAGAVEGLGSSAPRAIQYALLPWLANSPTQLVAANAISSLQEVVGIMVGGAIDVVLLHFTGSNGVLVATATICLVGALMLLSMRGAVTRLETGGSRPSVLKQLLAGVDHLRHDRTARNIVLALTLPLLLTGVAQSFASSVAIDLLHLGSAGTPLLITCVGVGGLVGGVASFALASRRNLVPYLIAGLVLSAIGPLVVAAAPVLGVTVVTLVAFGAGIAVQTVATHSLLQRIVPTRILGPVVGVTGFLGFAATGLGAITAAGLNSWLGVRGTLLVTGLCVAVAAGAVLLRMRSIDGEDLSDVAAQRVVDETTLFHLLSVAIKSSLARDVSSRDVVPGQNVIVEGERGDEFFMIETGSYDVLIGGKKVRVLGAGDSFGEIALLRDTPRTATIRGREAGRLWSLDREAFLGALTGNPASHELAQAVAARRLASNP
jgi:MFS family permease